jgi:hypothetical protein
MNSQNNQKTCPECNYRIYNHRCTNPDGCNYRGPGWNTEQRKKAWAMHGEWDRTVGAQYGYTGRD